MLKISCTSTFSSLNTRRLRTRREVRGECVSFLPPLAWNHFHRIKKGCRSLLGSTAIQRCITNHTIRLEFISVRILLLHQSRHRYNSTVIYKHTLYLFVITDPKHTQSVWSAFEFSSLRKVSHNNAEELYSDMQFEAGLSTRWIVEAPSNLESNQLTRAVIRSWSNMSGQAGTQEYAGYSSLWQHTNTPPRPLRRASDQKDAAKNPWSVWELRTLLEVKFWWFQLAFRACSRWKKQILCKHNTLV